MKKIYKAITANLFALAITAISANGQPILTAANTNAVPGDIFKVYDASSPASSAVYSTGANHTWDFSALWMGDSTTYTYIDATTTPFYNLAPTATVALYYPSLNFYNYFSGTPNDFSYLGGTSGSPAGIYSDPYKYYSYPLTYQDVFLDTFITSSSTCYSTHTADGYGTLIMPYGTLNNVLRLHEHTIVVPNGGGNNDIQDYYSWMLPGTHWAVYFYGEFNGANIASSYLIPNATGINDLASNQTTIDCFPNPFSSDLTLIIRNKNGGHGSISIKNTLGQIVFSESEISFNNPLAKTIDTGFLPKGIYLLEVIIDGERITKKILKQ